MDKSFTYFQTYDWCKTWFSEFGVGAGSASAPQARIFTASEGGKLVLVWPLMIEQGPMAVNALTWLSMPHCQYGNVLAENSEQARAAIAGCWDHIQGLPKVDCIELSSIPASSTLAKVIFSQNEINSAPSVSSIMDLTRFDTVKEYVDSLSKTTRRGRGRRRRKLETHGVLDFKVLEGGTVDYRDAVIEALRMKDIWLANTGKLSRALSMDGNAEFLAALPTSPNGAARALAGALTLDGKPISIEIGFEQNGNYISYLGAFDWDLRGYSPGKIGMDAMLRWGIENNLKSYDLLGTAASYKDDWSNLEVPLMSRVISLSVLGRARKELWIKRLRPALKNTLEVLPDQKRRLLASTLGSKFNGSSS